MNKQELIEKYKDKYPTLAMDLRSYGVFQELWKDIKQLDEPQKPVVPQFVADWLKYCKFTGVSLYHALEMGDLYFYNYANQNDDLKLKDFFETENNQETFARAWLDGYEVEEEKRYLVKMKGIEEHNSYLKYNKNLKHWYFGSLFIYNNDVDTRTYHTRKELEEAGFGEVFDNPMFEVEEVEG